MTRLGDCSLLINITHEETFNICIGTLFESTERVALLKKEFKEIFSLLQKYPILVFMKRFTNQLMGWLWALTNA